MRLTSIELLGFKSFLNRTVLRFNEGMTAIVGPNGCGKSNVVDAITWVLGERGTKSLRVKEMGDVIFHGSTIKKPVNMAEVTMSLTNEEREYAIKRRIYRDGTNEYYMNGNLVRLKDIQDFFLGTGIGLHSYAIIEQGNIEYFTQMKADERRVVIEETSGITRFEEKKRDAFTRMEEVRVSLERVEDVTKEIGKNFEKAREESDRLKVYNDLREKLKAIDIALLLDGHIKLTRRADKLLEREEALLKDVETRQTQKDDVKERARAKEEEISLVDGVTRHLEVDIKGKEKDMESRLLELDYLKEEKKRLTSTAGELTKGIQGLAAKTETNETEIDVLGKSVELEKADVEKAQQTGAEIGLRREELRHVREQCEKEAEEVRNSLFVTMTNITEIKNRLVEWERVVKDRELQQQRRVVEEARLKERLGAAEEKAGALGGRLDSERTALSLALSEEKTVSERFDKVSAEAVALRNQIEGLKGVKKGKEEIFKQMKSYGDGRKKEGIPYEQLINMIKTSKETEPFIEKFFSKETEYYVLTENDSHHLSRVAAEHGENYIFFPRKGLFTLAGREVELKLQQVGSLAEAFQRIDAGEEGLFLAGTFLVDSRGFIRKEQDGRSISIREFRQKMKLEVELATIDRQLQEKTALLNEALILQKELEKTRKLMWEKKRAKESTVVGTEREVLLIDAEIRTIKERLSEPVAGKGYKDEQSSIEFPFDQVERDKELLEEEKRTNERKLAELKQNLEEIKNASRQVDTEYHDISLVIERKRNQLKKNEEEMERKRSAREGYSKETQVLQDKMKQTNLDIQNIATKTEETEKNYIRLQEDLKKTVARYEEFKTRLGNMHMEKASLLEEIHVVDQEIEKARAKKEGVQRERLLLVEKRETIEEKLRHEYGIENVEAVPAPDAPCDGEERDRILDELSTLGDVNFRAHKEYADLKERLEFLERQKMDLIQAMESLKKTIAKIDSVSRELFLETFGRVNEAFKRFTNSLFKGGRGMLMLNQETHGVDLYVQPPGKKVVRMELLSGGEKALISLSFLLSLMDTKPSPFTLMDEIDAPLDDANLHSLLQIIETMGMKTQILLITHNRLTMEASNTIYGITMEEHGVSKTISIKL